MNLEQFVNFRIFSELASCYCSFKFIIGLYYSQGAVFIMTVFTTKNASFKFHHAFYSVVSFWCLLIFKQYVNFVRVCVSITAVFKFRTCIDCYAAGGVHVGLNMSVLLFLQLF